MRALAYLLATLAGCGDAMEGWISDLQSGEVAQRRTAARALADYARSHPDARALERLAQAVADPDAEVRRSAIDALGAVGPAARSSLESLAPALHDVEPPLRVRAALAIASIAPADERFVPVLVDAMRRGDGRVLLAVGALGRQAEWAVPTLLRLLSHEKPQLRALAAQTLGRIGVASSKSMTSLERALTDPNPAVQAAARRALEQLASKQPPP